MMGLWDGFWEGFWLLVGVVSVVGFVVAVAVTFNDHSAKLDAICAHEPRLCEMGK